MKKLILILSILLISLSASAQWSHPTWPYTTRSLYGGWNFITGSDTVQVLPGFGVALDTLYFHDGTKMWTAALSIEDSGFVKTTGDSMWGDYTSFNGSWLWTGTTGATPTSGAGTRMMWIPAKGAFRAGAVDDDQWDAANIGDYSFAANYESTASGYKSAAFGDGSFATGVSSFAAGESCIASGGGSFVAGDSNYATGLISTSFGFGNRSSGNYSFTACYGNIANSISLAVFGRNNDTTISTSLVNWVLTDPLFQIGNGTTTPITYNNAFQILKNGKTFIADLDNTTDAILIVDPTDSTSAFIGDVDITGTLTIPDTVTLNAVLAAGTVTKLKIGLVDSITIDTVNALRLYGNATVWDDYVVPATRTYVNPSTSLPAFSMDSVALKFVRDADSSEVAYFNVQIPHGARYGTDVVCSPHFHYMQYAAGDTTFQVALMYRIHKINGTSGAWTRLRYSKRAVYTFTTAPFHQVCEFPNITLNNISESSIIDFKLYRYDAAGNPATMYEKSFDVHFEFDKLGSNNEYPSH